MKLFVFPGNIEAEILAIGAQQVPYVRTECFSEMWFESETRLLRMTDNEGGRVLAFTASGTGAMDSCVGSLKPQVGNKKALVINGGTFGQRWCDLCTHYDISHDAFPVSFGCDPDYDALRAAIVSGAYSVLFMQHHETSCGILYDLPQISAWCQEANVCLVVDAIGSFLIDAFSMKRTPVDFAVISSHKGLNLPPGLSFVLQSEKWITRNDWGRGPYYFDWKVYAENFARGQSPYSPDAHLFWQLHERLKRLETTGVSHARKLIEEKAIAFRQACRREGWRLKKGRLSNCLTGVNLPCPARPVVDALAAKGYFVMPSAEPDLVRVAHLGISTVRDHIDVVEEMRACIPKSQP